MITKLKVWKRVYSGYGHYLIRFDANRFGFWIAHFERAPSGLDFGPAWRAEHRVRYVGLRAWRLWLALFV